MKRKDVNSMLNSIDDKLVIEAMELSRNVQSENTQNHG